MPQAVQYFLIPIPLPSLLVSFSNCEATRGLEYGVLGDQAKGLGSSRHPGELRKSLDFPWDGCHEGGPFNGVRMEWILTQVPMYPRQITWGEGCSRASVKEG